MEHRFFDLFLLRIYYFARENVLCHWPINMDMDMLFQLLVVKLKVEGGQSPQAVRKNHFKLSITFNLKPQHHNANLYGHVHVACTEMLHRTFQF